MAVILFMFWHLLHVPLENEGILCHIHYVLGGFFVINITEFVNFTYHHLHTVYINCSLEKRDLLVKIMMSLLLFLLLWRENILEIINTILLLMGKGISVGWILFFNWRIMEMFHYNFRGLSFDQMKEDNYVWKVLLENGL